jgi:hypothetical protein
MSTLTLFDVEIPVPYPGECLCGSRLPTRANYEAKAKHCSYWCYLVEFGPAYFTLETIAPWLKSNRRRTSHSSLPTAAEPSAL